MFEIDLEYFCTQFYGITGVPIRLYKSDRLVLQVPNLSTPYDLVSRYLPELMNDTLYITYKMSPQFLCYGIVKLIGKEHSFIIGPNISMTITHKGLIDILNDAAIPLSYLDEFKTFINSITPLGFEKFLSLLSFINYIMNNKRMTPEALLLLSNNYHNFQPTIEQNYVENTYQAKEETQLHNTYMFEKQFLSYIKSGDAEKLNQLLQNGVPGTAGKLARENLRQSRNIFIGSITQVSRSAIEGGLDIETSYCLTDIYIQQVESLNNVDSIAILQQQMVMDFTDRVSKSKHSGDVSLVISKCINYVINNTNRSIRTKDISSYVGMSNSHISKKFKEEMSISLTDYINLKKIDEAKGLLVFTDKSLSEISTYLCYSSQSYFQNVFKKIVGVTPKAYRDEHAQK